MAIYDGIDESKLKAARQELSWGEAFHTSLRKSSDTDWSVLLWNMINEISDTDRDRAKNERVWSHFVSWCEECYHNSAYPASKIVQKYIAAYDLYEFRDALKRTSSLSMFIFALKLCDKETYDDIDYAFYYVEELYMKDK